jgi:hypothetical protein
VARVRAAHKRLPGSAAHKRLPGSAAHKRLPGSLNAQLGTPAVCCRSSLEHPNEECIGSDTLTGVNDADYQPPFPLTAKFNKLTINIDRPQLSPADIQKLKAAMQEKAKAD